MSSFVFCHGVVWAVSRERSFGGACQGGRSALGLRSRFTALWVYSLGGGVHGLMVVMGVDVG